VNRGKMNAKKAIPLSAKEKSVNSRLFLTLPHHTGNPVPELKAACQRGEYTMGLEEGVC
jgi:hypothetical protein